MARRTRADDVAANVGTWMPGAAAVEGAAAADALAPALPSTTPAPAERGRPDKRRMVGVYLDAAEVEALDARAAAEDRSVSYIVRAAVRAYLGMT